jgi:phosphoglycerate dehydrogenase-like enzyme
VNYWAVNRALKRLLQMKKKVLVAVDDFSEAHIQAMDAAVAAWAEIIRLPQTSEETVYRNALAESHICIGWPLAEWLFNTSVQLLQTGSSGWENYQHKGLDQLPAFSLCTAKGIYSIGVAEHAIAMMLALVRRIPVHVHDKDHRQFRRHLPYAPEITGAAACIIGMGDIGKEIAKRCRGLGMKVTGIVKNGKDDLIEYADLILPVSQLENAVADADHIFLSIPGSAENDKVFTKHIFSKFKPSAFFYNVSRGSTVDEEALCEYLRTGKLAGAGLDVSQTEPLPAESELWNLGDNILITGHSAGLSSGYTNRFCKLVIRNLTNYDSGVPLENKVI